MPTPLGFIDHRPFAGFSVGLLFGRRPDGSLARVDQVPQGQACDCVCPAADCAKPLIACKGPKVTHHFRHATEAGGCSGAETCAHLWAKAVLEREKAIWIPEIKATHKGVTVVTHRRQLFRFDSVRLETRRGEVVPDVVLTKAGRDLIVEVRVTHACGPEKIAKLEAAGTSVLEVNLKAYRTSTDEAKVRKAILDTAPRTWLVNPKVQAAKDTAREKAAEIETKRRQVAETAARDLRQRLMSQPKPATGPHPLCDAAEELGLGRLLNGPEPDISGFSVPARVWRAAVLIRIVLPAAAQSHPWYTPNVNRDQAADEIRDLWAAPLQGAASADTWSALSRQPDPIILPRDAVEAFIEELVQDGLLYEFKGSLQMPEHHAQRLREATKAIKARAARATALAEQLEAVLKLAEPDERLDFNLEDWMHSPPLGFAQSPNAMIETGGADFEHLKADLSGLQSAAWNWTHTLPTDTLGLPVSGFLNRQAEKRRLAAAAAEAARQVEEEKARRDRLERIERYATEQLGWTGGEWLDLCPTGFAETRRQLAADSKENFDRVCRSIEWTVRDRQRRQEEADALARRQAALRRRTAAVLNETHAAFFLANRRDELGSRTPLDACDTDRGLEDAAALLPRLRRR